MNKRANRLRVLLSIGVIILVMLLAGQTMSFINYEFTVSVGLQEPFGEIGVAVNKAFGVGDTIIYLPLLFVGLIGLWQKKRVGHFCNDQCFGNYSLLASSLHFCNYLC